MSIEISDEIKERLIDVQKGLEATGADLKLVEPQNVHLTMRFLGNVPEDKIDRVKEAVRRSGKTLSPYDLQVKGIGAFPNLGYIRVIWAGVGRGKDETVALRRELDGSLAERGFPPKDKDFVPHVTLARMRSAKAKERIVKRIKEMSDKDFGTCRADAIELKKSKLTREGPIYTTLERVELS